MLSSLPYAKWKDPAGDAYRYGLAFAAYFGPSSRSLVTAAEIGNEPGEFSDEQYRTIFESMARGFRKGDPKLKVVTCAAIAGASHKYAKSLNCVKGLEPLYDVINVHSYAQVQGWPTWERSYPEDPSIVYLKDIQDAIDWKNAHAPDKDVWITEFGWDSTTQTNHKEGTFKDWKGSTDLEQAAYVVRSWLVFSAMDLQRAYMYWFNDNDEPSVHAASGLTRNDQPKPAYWAAAHLFKTLGDYRFSRKIAERAGELYAYEYTHESDGTRVIAAWVPERADCAKEITLPVSIGVINKIERMPLTNETKTDDYRLQGDSICIQGGGSPVYIFIGR
jgi:serine/threonine-protein kinase ATR